MLFFNSQSNGECSFLLIAAAFSNCPILGKTPLPVKNSYSPSFTDDKV